MADEVTIMPCLDMKDGKVVKGIHFVELRDAGDPVECAAAYCRQGADELAFLDITATVEKRKTMLEVFRKVAKVATVPLTLGGGIKSLKDIEDALKAGAHRASMSSAAVRKPKLIEEAAKEFGSEHIVVAIDVDLSDVTPSGYEVYIDGGRTPTGIDAFDFARQAEDMGAGVILPTSKDKDGTKDGYDVELLRGMAERVKAPLVASGGAGKMSHFFEAATEGKATILLAASVFHFGEIKIPELKAYLKKRGLKVRN